jgi:hypothetical protein
VDQDGDLLAVEEYGGAVVLLDLAPADALRRPFTEPCDGCTDGHIGERVGGPQGPCESCLGLGRVLFAFHADGLAASLVPPAVANPWMWSR